MREAPPPCPPTKVVTLPAPAPSGPAASDPFPPRRCAPDAYPFDISDPEHGLTQPLMSKDGAAVAYCSDVDVNLEKPRVLSVLDTSSGDVVYQRHVSNAATLEAAGRYLAQWNWTPMARIPGAPDPVAAAQVPESAKPFFYMDAIGMARSDGVQITYREPVLRVESPRGTVVHEERIQTWSYENHIGPDGTSNTVWHDVHCRGFILTYLSDVFGSVDLGFLVVVLRKQGGTPQCGVDRSADLNFVRLMH